MTREHDSMQKTRGSSDFEYAVIIGPDFTGLEGVREGSGSRTAVGKLNPIPEMDSAYAKTYLGGESIFKPKFLMSWK